MNSRKATAMPACTASTSARSVGRKVAAEQRDRGAEGRVRISTHSSIEPSWLPQTPAIL